MSEPVSPKVVGADDALSRPGRVLAAGSAWTMLAQGATALTDLAAAVLAARLVPPADFGLMAIAMLAINLLNTLTQTGFERALVQRQDVEGFLDVGWTFQVARGVLLMVIIFAGAVPMARFYDQPTLVPIFMVMSTSLFVQSLRNVTNVIFARSLRFRAMFFVSVLSAVAKLAVVLPAIWILRSVWALVVAQIASAVIEVIATYVAHPHRPKLDFDLEKALDLFAFSKWVTASNLVALLVTRGDDMFVSKFFGTSALGYYTLAYQIANLPATQVTHVLGRVSFPTYARLQGDPVALRGAFLGVMKTTVLATGLVSVALWMVIPGVVEFVIGSKWAPIIPLVRILALAGFVRSVAALGAALFHACGVPRLDFTMNLPRLGVLVLLVWPASALAGLSGAALVVLMSVAACLPTWFYGLKQLADVRAIDVARENRLAVAASMLLAAALWVAFGLWSPGSLVAFAAQVIVGGALWLLVMWGLGRVTSLRLFDELSRLRGVLRKG